MVNAANDERMRMLVEIARETLRVKTLEIPGNTPLDMHTCGIDDVLRALEAAYDAGLLTARRVFSGMDGER